MVRDLGRRATPLVDADDDDRGHGGTDGDDGGATGQAERSGDE
jgi:hypothetical protein